LVFNELVDAAHRNVPGFSPAYMLDQSHNVTDPIESLIESAVSVARAYAQALLVDRAVLETLQQENDAFLAASTLRAAFRLDVDPILAVARLESGGACDPIRCYRSSGYRIKKAEQRPQDASRRSGIV
jgi:L-rhamnose isomerase/sugar isomerase